MVFKTISVYNKNKAMAALALFAMFMQPVAVFAQGMAGGGPIDIQANEQEFGEGHVIAKGNVRVTYKDSVVLAPMATLYRDPAGSPQKAVFTGHPHLTQGLNKIDSDVLIFEIATQKIIADGHAHSEVLQNAPFGGPMDGAEESAAPTEDLNTPGFGNAKAPAPAKKGTKVAAKSKTPAKPAMKNGQINWPTKAGDEASQEANGGDAANAKSSTAKTGTARTTTTKSTAIANKPKSVIVPHSADDEDDAVGAVPPIQTTEQLLAPPAPSAASTAKAADSAAKKATKEKTAPADKIITDSRYQEYHRDTGRFEARGDVHVKHGDIYVISDRLQLVYGADLKPETALFTGHVSATQNDNNTQADSMTYFLATQRLQASGNVKSKVIQKKGDVPKKGGPDDGSQVGADSDSTKTSKAGKPDKTNQNSDTTAFTSSSKKFTEPELNSLEKFDRPAAKVEKTADKPVDKTKAADASIGKGGFKVDLENKDGEPMYIDSDAQDYNKDSGRMAAQGNVKVRYGDTTGVGQNVVLVRNIDGQAEKLIFTGRSQIIQPGKRWIGDKITMMVNDRKVLAQGNTRAYILQTAGQADPTSGIGGKRAPRQITPTIPSAVPSNATPGTVASKKAPTSASTEGSSKSATADSATATNSQTSKSGTTDSATAPNSPGSRLSPKTANTQNTKSALTGSPTAKQNSKVSATKIEATE